MGTIQNGKNTPINVQTGSIPNVSGALRNWFQPMCFVRVTKEMIGGQAYEVGCVIRFRGVIQPLSGRRLELKPEGERFWNWQLLHADPALKLSPDEVVVYRGVQCRIMSQKDYSIYGYVEYELVEDWQGAGPLNVDTNPPEPIESCDPDPCGSDLEPVDSCPGGQGLTTEVVLSSTAWTALPPSALQNRRALSVQNRSGIEIALNFDASTVGYAGVLVPNGFERHYAIQDNVFLYAKAKEGTPTITVEELS